MTKPKDAKPDHQPNPPSQPRGRYRFQRGQPLDPSAGVHPEMGADHAAAPVGTGIPNSPQELMAMQANNPERPEKPARQQSAKVQEVLDLIEKLDTTAAEDQQIALTLVRQLEGFHDEVVVEMKSDDDAKHTQIISWAVDADRLYRSRMLLESVDLE
ncbi:hypothetical protein KBZ19_12615 [Synechococcus sp. L2F]|uniref:hypothetical protein n=1 Tax=Synechococcus sp. L2F TaxID=2823739 RepID=UPI0020CB9D6E|nr:hypothetical protein [Synechococcus sp. L2F]MCP9829328.1 hypothetical protein [Synechococcus sp. L2F]